MRLLTCFFFTAIFLTAAASSAAPEAASAGPAPVVERVSQWNILIGYWNWTEKLTLERNGLTATDWANMQAQAIGAGWRKARGHWGYGIEGLFLNGIASGGGNSSITYQESRVNFTALAAKPYGIYRLDRFVEFGFAVPILYKDLHWPVNDPALSVSTKAGSLNTYLFFLNTRPARDFMIHAGIGPAFDVQSTIWNLELEYFL